MTQFNIDLTHSTGGLAITMEGRPSNPHEKEAFEFVNKYKGIVPYSKTLECFKLLAATGHLYFKGKPLYCDLFGRMDCKVIVEEDLRVCGYVKNQDALVDIKKLDFLGCGPPHWYIQGSFLKLIGSEIPWNMLKKLRELNSPWSGVEIEALKEEGLQIEFKGASSYKADAELDPVPILVLKDRTGAFADLYMCYGEGREIPYHDPRTVSEFKRKRDVEKSWEKDLLETSFIQKITGTSRYYCPLDKVPKSLAFLLEIGWRVRDAKGNRVARQTDINLDLTESDTKISIQGKVRFDEFEADLKDIAGTFNRKERFIHLGNGVVGLMPESLQLSSVLEEGEIVGEKLQIKKNRFGVLRELLESNLRVTCDEKIKQFNGVVHSSPGPGFKGVLRPYQQEGLNWLTFLEKHRFGGILADDMGLGKTVQVLALLSCIQSDKPSLIVLPNSLVFNWKREVEKFLPEMKVHIHHGADRQNKLDIEKGLILTTYTTLRNDLSLFKSKHFECIFLDEAQTIKNAHTQIAQAVCELQGRFRLTITGTPIENHLNELWSQFRFLMPDLLGEQSTFEAEVQASSSDSRYLQRIRRRIKPFVLRRKKEDVAKDLPEKIEQVVWIEMPEEQRTYYDQFLASAKKGLEGKGRMEILESILRLRQICCHSLLVTDELSISGKLEALLEDLETIFEEGKKALVYSQFTSMLSLIGKALKERQWNYTYLDGSTTNRADVVDRFQNDPQVSFFLISLKAGGIGLNLTAADYVLLYDPWWNEAAENQAINRAHRIGRCDTVIAKRYVVAESIEEKMMTLKTHKRTIIENILDHDDLSAGSSLTDEDLKFLLT